MFHVFRHAFVDLVGLTQVRITVRSKIGIAISAESTHTAIRPAFDTHIHPEIFIAHDHLQDPQCPGIIIACLAVISGTCHILDLGGGLEAFVQLSVCKGFF